MAGRKGEVRDRPDLVITPGPEQADGTRESRVQANNTVAHLPNGAKVAVLIRRNQDVEVFEILGRDRKWTKLTPAPSASGDLKNDEDYLKEWHHTSPKQKWIVYIVGPGQVPEFASTPVRTRFKLRKKPKAPQDILWVAVDADEGFGVDHRIYGFTEYPRETGKKRGKKPTRRR